jgi:putative PIG3 family NAD(P)H quinone oxidoreductase
MRAAVIRTFGSADVIEVREVPTPQPKGREILVRVHGSALNRADILQRLGRYAAPADAPPDIPGIEFAGEVAALGPETTRWHVGDRVFSIVGGGAHAEYLLAHESAVAGIPDGMSWHDAAAVPEAFITAHDSMLVQARLAAGESVLIHAVASGVGLAALQLARASGARPFGTSRTAEKLERARAYGLEDGVVLGGDLSALGARVAEWTAGRGVDVVIDLLGGPYLAASIAGLAPRGRIMLVGALAGSEAAIDVRQVLSRRATLTGTVLRSRGLPEKIAVVRSFAANVVPLFGVGRVQPVIDSVFPLADIANAHRRMESNATVGKVVLQI